MDIKCIENNIIVSDIADFDLTQIFECGQCFRWNANIDGTYTGVAKGHALTIEHKNNEIWFYATDEKTFYDVWYDYFDLGRNYGEIKHNLSSDPILADAIKFGEGIRILKQDLWETIISFIISASNNIPRIKKIIEAFCTLFGQEIVYMGHTYYTFPEAKSLKGITTEDLAPIKAGFRDKYIMDAVSKVNSGELCLSDFSDMDTASAKKALLSIYGIGDKVSDCILLFGLSRPEAFPVDVWIKRIMEYCYFGNKQAIKDVRQFADDKFASLAGFAQQYLFYYARENKLG